MFTTISAARQHVLCLSLLKLERPITLRGGLLKAFDLHKKLPSKFGKSQKFVLHGFKIHASERLAKKPYELIQTCSSSELRASVDKQNEPQDFGVFEDRGQTLGYHVYTSG